jgi:hypothetical protein
MRPAEEIQKLIKQLNDSTSQQMDERVLKDSLNALDESKKTKPALTKPIFWRTIMKSNITKFAAATALVIGIFWGINYLDGSISSIAWAKVTENVEQIDTFKFILKIIFQNNEANKFTEDVQAQWAIYLSSEYGFRMDISNKDNVVSWYVPFEKDKIIMVIHDEKKWIQMPYSQDTAKQYNEKDPRDYIKRFMSCKYTKLGRKIIDGFEVEGIEVINPPSDIEHLENAVGYLWVDVKTQLPVRIEIKGTVELNTVLCNMDFSWDEKFNAGIFKIPSDYTSILQ